MKRVAVVFLVVAFTSSYALGGTVSFDPTSGTILFNNPDDGSAIGFWDVTLNADSTSDPFTAIGAVIGVDALNAEGSGPQVDFAIDSTFAALFTGIEVDVPGPGVYDSDIFIDGFVLAGLFPAIPLPQFAGQLIIDATGVEPGDYAILIDGTSNQDDGRSALAGAEGLDSLTGMATFTVVPEPGTLSLLGLAALGLIRRRKSAA